MIEMISDRVLYVALRVKPLKSNNILDEEFYQFLKTDDQDTAWSADAELRSEYQNKKIFKRLYLWSFSQHLPLQSYSLIQPTDL